MADNLCSECIDDKYLREIIEEQGEPEFCDVCQKNRSCTITIARLGELLEPIIREHYSQGEEIPRFFEDDRDDYWEQEGDDLGHIVQEALGQYFDFNDEIAQAVIDAEDCDPRDGDIPFFDRTANYVQKEVQGSYTFQSRWSSIGKELISSRRFFSSAAKSLFDDLFHDIDDVLCQAGAAPDDCGVVSVLPANYLLYRSRVCYEKELRVAILRDPLTNVGPPPSSKATAGRMNPEGISVFYGATDRNTCLAELRPALGGEAAIITLKSTRPLRMLDFTRMGTAYKALSYFQSDFADQATRLEFLRRLGYRVSRPITPGREAQYLITQTMTEYLAHVHSRPFDGMLFPSAQRAGGTNVVLFLANAQDRLSPPVSYVKGSLKFFQTTEISYKHRQRRYDPAGGGKLSGFFEEEISE